MPELPEQLRGFQTGLRWLRPLIPVALFVALFGTCGALASAAHARSTVLVAVASVAVVGSFAGLAGWVLMSDKLNGRPPRHVPWSARQWQDFDASFWALVSRGSGGPPGPRPDRNEA